MAVRQGARVHAGDLLAELEDKDYLAAEKQWEAARAAAAKEVDYLQKALQTNKTIRDLDVVHAEAELKYRETDLDAREKLRNALEKLSKTGGASLISFYEACSKYAEAQYALALAKEQLCRAQENLTTGLLHDEFALSEALAKREAATVGRQLAQRNREACRVRCPLEGFVEKLGVVQQLIARYLGKEYLGNSNHILKK